MSDAEGTTNQIRPAQSDPQGPPGEALSSWALILALGLFCLAAGLRLNLVPGSFVGADSMDPFWRSWRMLQGDLFPPLHVPESGYGLYVSLLPTFIEAYSLGDILYRNALLHALAAPLLFLGMAWLLPPLLGSPPHKPQTLALGAGLGAGLLLALSGELMDTAVAGARTYLGLPFTTLMTLGCLGILGGRRLGPYLLAIACPFALMNHPFALPLVLGLIPVLWLSRTPIPWVHWLLPGTLGALIAAPRAWQLLGGFLDQGAAHGQSLSAIATSNSMDSGILLQLKRSIGDAFFVGGQGASLILGVALGTPLLLMAFGVIRRGKAGPRALGLFGLWLALSLLLFAALALALGYVQHYHLRLYIPVIATSGFIALALGFSALPLKALSTSAILRGLIITLLALPGALIWDAQAYQQLRLRPQESINRLTTHEALATAILPIANQAPIVLDALHINTEYRTFAPAVALDLIARGLPLSQLPTRPEQTRTSTFCIALVGPTSVVETLIQLPGAAEPLYVLRDQRLEGGRPGMLSLHCIEGQWALAALGTSICANLPPGASLSTGSTYNYMAPLDTELRSEWVEAWWPTCIRRP